MTVEPFEWRAVEEPVEFRSAVGGRRIGATGVAMRYGARSKPIDGKFRELFQPGAFTKTIREQDIRSHNEHHGPYLARTGAGSLRLIDDRSALRYELDLPDTTAGRDAAALLERGDIKGSSIGFRALPKGESWSLDADGMPLRTVTEARLSRVDLTVAPVYDDSTAEMALRSLAAYQASGRLPRRDVDESTVVRPKIGWMYAPGLPAERSGPSRVRWFMW